MVPFCDPKSDQIGPKRVPKSIKKVIEKLVEFGIDFLTIVGPFWLPTSGAQGVQRIRVSGSRRLPEPTWGPNGPQAPSKLDFWSILVGFLLILDRFWADFGQFFPDFTDFGQKKLRALRSGKKLIWEHYEIQGADFGFEKTLLV